MTEWADLFHTSGDRPRGCPAPDLIQAAQAQVLPPGIQDAVSAHIAGCVVCRSLAQSLDAIADEGPTAEESARMLKRVRESAPTPVPRADRGYRWWWAGAAAAAMLAVIGWWVVGRDSPTAPSYAPSSVVRVEPPPIATIDSTSLSPAEAGDLAATLVPYRDGRFDEAARSLTAFVRRYPQNVYGQFYLGVVELRRSSDRQAVIALESAERLAAVSKSPLATDAAWYLSVAYRRLGEEDKAWQRLTALCGPRGLLMKACDALREIVPTIELRGTVTDTSGLPLDGAKVSEHMIRGDGAVLMSEATAFSTIASADGRYRVNGEPVRRAAIFLMRASKPGYFTDNAIVSYGREATADFALHPLRFVPVGRPVQSTTARQAMCDPTELCQRYAVTPHRSGTLEVTVLTSASEYLDVYVETPDGKSYGPRQRAPRRLEIPVTAGSIIQIRVLSEVEVQFELRTTLR